MSELTQAQEDAMPFGDWIKLLIERQKEREAFSEKIREARLLIAGRKFCTGK